MGTGPRRAGARRDRTLTDVRRSDAVLAVAFLAFAGFIAFQILGSARPEPELPPNTASARAAPIAGSRAPEAVVEADPALPPPVRDLGAIRARLASASHGTYIADLFAARDSHIARWPERRSPPVRVWIEQQGPLAASNPQLVSNVRRAFADWGRAGVPLEFSYVDDSSRAEVKVFFVDRFSEAMSGRTLWVRDTHWWILRGDIHLALHRSSGQPLSPAQMYAIALHEIGHLLGLDHTADTTSIMASRVRTDTLSASDVATMRLIYSLPPGPTR